MDKLNHRPNCLVSFVKFNSAIDCIIGILGVRSAIYDFIKGKNFDIFSFSPSKSDFNKSHSYNQLWPKDGLE